MSNFKFDLEQEHILNTYLDDVYESKKLKFSRITDFNKQHQGIDIIFHHNSNDYFIDEKAQLHYLNQDLPTFTFELSYLNKNHEIKEGWLLDTSKKTHYYFLITAIILKTGKTKLTDRNDIKSVKITSVNRSKLIGHLKHHGLTRHELEAYDYSIRHAQSFGKNTIPELDKKSAGIIYYTKHLNEQPMNLQLRLQYLIDCRIAKAFHGF
ncbi:hypothetical protein GSB9_02030 [Flavobacteriaceae bacterium GSB9]|nr:hypothetical protein GSB9_02030 [Flavobacteriaceae bacterium GSB9]